MAVLRFHDIIQLETISALTDVAVGTYGDDISIHRLQGTGIFQDPNEFCVMLAVMVPICLYFLTTDRNAFFRAACAGLLPLFGYAIYLTYSRGGFLAFVGGLGTLFWTRFGWKKTAAIGLVGVPVLLILFAGRQTDISTSTGTASTRIELWRDWMQVFRDHPVSGAGITLVELDAKEKTAARTSPKRCSLTTPTWQGFADLGFFGGCLFLKRLHHGRLVPVPSTAGKLCATELRSEEDATLRFGVGHGILHRHADAVDVFHHPNLSDACVSRRLYADGPADMPGRRGPHAPRSAPTGDFRCRWPLLFGHDLYVLAQRCVISVVQEQACALFAKAGGGSGRGSFPAVSRHGVGNTEGVGMSVSPSRLRVAHVTQGLEVGGQERLLVEMARHRDRNRFEWIVVVLGGRGPLAEALEAANVRVLFLDAPTGLRPGLCRRLARWLHQERIDVIHTHDDRPLIYGMPAAWWAGIGRRIHTHHHGRVPQIGRRQLWLIRLAARFATRFVCVSHDSARFMIEQGIAEARVRTLWNGVDLGRFSLQGPSAAGSVVTVARLSPEKDVANLLRAAAKVVAASPDVRFEIAGDGPCRDELRQLAAELHLTDNVIFHGEVKDIPALLARARLFVLPSQTEGISLTLLEAMARGLPLVTTSVGGNPEVVEAGNTGLLVPPRDPEALAEAISALIANPERGRQMGLAGRQRVENCFDIRKMMAQYEALYSE